MKKILVLALALVLAFSMFSCGGDDTLKAFTKAVNATDPEVIDVDTKFSTSYGDLLSNAKTTFAEDGSFTLVYSYEQFNTSAVGDSDEVKVKLEKTVTCDKDGNYSDGGDLAATSTATTGHKLKLSKKKVDYKVSADGNVLTATIKAKNTESVLGVEIDADVILVLTKNADKIVSFTMNYELELGKVEVICNYTPKAEVAPAE